MGGRKQWVGRRSPMKDCLSGEEITYQYDSLNRLISAATTGPEWGLAFAYDGFGNLTNQTLTKGSAPTLAVAVDPATNRILGSGFTYDANGNITATATQGFTYDTANRMSATGSWSYRYDPWNRKVWSSGCLHLYGPNGQLIGDFQIWDATAPEEDHLHGTEYVYFAGHRLTIAYDGAASATVTDRLGSGRVSSSTVGYYYPYGESKHWSAPMFATYPRRAYEDPNLYYAMNRWYSSQIGRFTTPDPYRASASLANPQSWNRYSYVENDPVNFNDPSGLNRCAVSGRWYSASGPPDDRSYDWGYWWGWYECGEEYGGGGGRFSPPDESGGGGGSSSSKATAVEIFRQLSSDCQKGLGAALSVRQGTNPELAAKLRLDALDRAKAAMSTLVAATTGTGIDWTMLAAIGIRETGFRNIKQRDGLGVGVFQIDVGENPSVSERQALSIGWAAKWAANTLSANSAMLSRKYPNLDGTQLLQATAASWNLGVGGISGNPNTIDVGSTGGNYGSNVLSLMDCFH